MSGGEVVGHVPKTNSMYIYTKYLYTVVSLKNKNALLHRIFGCRVLRKVV